MRADYYAHAAMAHRAGAAPNPVVGNTLTLYTRFEVLSSTDYLQSLEYCPRC